MHNRLLVLAATGLLLSSCVNKAGAEMGLFTAKAPVIAVLSDDLFTGTVVGYPDMTGTINIASTLHPDVRCIGQYKFTSAEAGVGQMTCNDGATATFQFHSLSALSGYGLGTSTRGPVSFAYGLTPDDAKQYLTLPKGKTLHHSKNGGLSLSI